MPISREQFESYFPALIADMVAYARETNLPQNALEWFETVSQCFLWSFKFLCRTY